MYLYPYYLGLHSCTTPSTGHVIDNSDSDSTNVSLGTNYGLPGNSGSIFVITNELYLEDDT